MTTIPEPSSSRTPPGVDDKDRSKKRADTPRTGTRTKKAGTRRKPKVEGTADTPTTEPGSGAWWAF